jgi:hypothetical protein
MIVSIIGYVLLGSNVLTITPDDRNDNIGLEQRMHAGRVYKLADQSKDKLIGFGS